MCPIQGRSQRKRSEGAPALFAGALGVGTGGNIHICHKCPKMCIGLFVMQILYSLHSNLRKWAAAELQY